MVLCFHPSSGDPGIPLLLAAVSCLLLAWPMIATMVFVRLGFWFLGSGNRAAARKLRKWVWLMPKKTAWTVSNSLLIRANSEDGDADGAAALLDQCIESVATDPRRASFMACSAVDIWNNAGQYRKALRAIRRFPVRRAERARHPGLYGTMQVNRAEALHNLGRDRLALRLLARTKPFADRSPLSRNGALTLEAWILAHMGQGERARGVLARLDARPLSPHYAAEVHFTRAAVELSCGQIEAALVEANLGLASAVRSSSERNGRFILGKIEIERGNFHLAVLHYEAGRAHTYRRQGGASLHELGQLYERLGKLGDAQQAYEDATVRDPESLAARECRARLEELRARPESLAMS